MVIYYNKVFTKIHRGLVIFYVCDHALSRGGIYKSGLKNSAWDMKNRTATSLNIRLLRNRPKYIWTKMASSLPRMYGRHFTRGHRQFLLVTYMTSVLPNISFLINFKWTFFFFLVSNHNKLLLQSFNLDKWQSKRVFFFSIQFRGDYWLILALISEKTRFHLQYAQYLPCKAQSLGARV